MPKFELPKFDLPKVTTPKISRVDLPKVKLDAKPLYAGAGVAELAVETVKEYAVGVQKRVGDYQKDATERFASFEPKTLQARAKASYDEISAEAKTLSGKAKAKLDETTSSATGTYEDLAKRGEVFVARLRGKPAGKPVVTKPPASKSTAKKAPAKKSPARNTTKAPTTKAPTSKAPTSKA